MLTAFLTAYEARNAVVFSQAPVQTFRNSHVLDRDEDLVVEPPVPAFAIIG